MTIGDKNFAEENILGQLYTQALQAKGYKVTLKENVGSSEIIYKALTSGQIEMYPEYTGTLLSAIANQTKEPASATAAYNEAKAFVEKHGLTLLNYTPFYDSDALATLPSYASAHHLTSIADLKPLGKSVTLGAPPEFATRFEGLLGLKQEYGVVPTFKPIAIELSYKALESGQVDVQNVFTHRRAAAERQVQGAGRPQARVRLPERGAGGEARACSRPRARRSLRRSTRVSALLTIKAIQQMNAAVSIDKQSAASVAKQFLAANGLS